MVRNKVNFSFCKYLQFKRRHLATHYTPFERFFQHLESSAIKSEIIKIKWTHFGSLSLSIRANYEGPSQAASHKTNSDDLTILAISLVALCPDLDNVRWRQFLSLFYCKRCSAQTGHLMASCEVHSAILEGRRQQVKTCEFWQSSIRAQDWVSFFTFRHTAWLRFCPPRQAAYDKWITLRRTFFYF